MYFSFCFALFSFFIFLTKATKLFLLWRIHISIEKSRPYLGFLQPWFIFAMYKVKEWKEGKVKEWKKWHLTERSIPQKAPWCQIWCFLKGVLSSPCLPTVSLFCLHVESPTRVWLSSQVVLAQSCVCKGDSCLILLLREFCFFSSHITTNIKGDIVQIRILTGAHNHNYKTWFPSGMDGRERNWKWTSVTRRLRRQWQICLLCNELQDKPIWRWHNLKLPFITASCVHGWDPSWESAETDESNQQCFLYAFHTNEV